MVSGNRLVCCVGEFGEGVVIGSECVEMSADVNEGGGNTTIQAPGLGLSSPDDLEELRSRDAHRINSITSMDLSHNLITSLRGFAKFTGLVELRLSGNRVKSLDGCLDGLAHLKHLDLSYNRLTSLEDAGSSLGNLMALERLELQGNSISQLLGLQQCWRPPPPSSPLNASDSMPPGVTYLDLRDNRIEDSTQLLYISGMTIKQLLMRGSREHRNTICEDANYRLMVLQTLPDIEVLDGRIVTEDERREARSKALVILRCTRKDERVKLPADRTGSTLAQHSTRRSASHLRNPWVDTSRSTGSREKAASEPLGGGRSSLRRSQQVEAVESLSTQNDSAEANRRIQGDEHRECERQVRQLRAMVATMQEHYEAMLREASARLDGTRDQLEAIEEERRRLEASVKHGEKAKLKHEAALAKDLKLLEADMEKRNRRLKTLEENLTKSEQEGQEAHKVVEELQREKEELLTAKEDLITKCSNMEEKIKDLEESMLKMRELELEVSRLKAHKAEEPVAAPVKPSREDVSAEVEAAKREAIAVVEEKASRLEGEVADLKRELQERREQIRCQRQAYVALEEQFRLKAERDESRVTELTAQLGSERKMKEAVEAKLRKVEEELDKEKVSSRELRTTVEDRDRVVALEAAGREREIEELRRELNKAKEEAHKHRKALRMVELEVTKDIERMVTEHGKQRSKQQEEHEAEVKALRDVHEKEVNRLKEEIAGKEKEVVGLAASVEHEMTKAREFKEATSALRKDLLVACKQLEKEVQQEGILQKKVQGLQAELERLKVETESERGERSRRMEEYEAMVSELRKKAADAERAREAAEAIRCNYDENMKGARRREEELESKVKGLEELVRKHAIEATVKERMVADSAEHVKALKKQIQGLEADLEQCQKERKKRDRDWQSLLDEEVSKADRARDKLAPTEEKLAAAEGEVERLREEVSQKDESLRYVTSEVEEMRRAMQEDTDIKVAEVERRLNREHEKSLLELDRRIEEAQQRNDREVARLSRDREAMKRRAHVAEERVKHVEKELRTVLNEYEHLKVQCEAKMRRAADLLLESGLT